MIATSGYFLVSVSLIAALYTALVAWLNAAPHKGKRDGNVVPQRYGLPYGPR